jgi:hypothetical protein
VVLDEAPPELINLMGYLEAVTTGLSFDLIAVHSYTIGEHRIAVPQRLDPEHRPEPPPSRPARSSRRATGHYESGVQPFRDLIPETPEQYQSTLAMMADWADELVRTNSAVTAETWLGVEDCLATAPLPRREGRLGVTMALRGRQARNLVLA